jgi:hypothetical protein
METARTAIETGDFIQLGSWFGDVWSQVLEVHHYDEMSFVYSCYSTKYGEERRIDTHTFWDKHSHLHDLRKVAKASNPEDMTFVEKCKRTGVVYTADTYYGGFGRGKKWETPLNMTYIHQRIQWATAQSEKKDRK